MVLTVDESHTECIPIAISGSALKNGDGAGRITAPIIPVIAAGQEAQEAPDSTLIHAFSHFSREIVAPNDLCLNFYDETKTSAEKTRNLGSDTANEKLNHSELALPTPPFTPGTLSEETVSINIDALCSNPLGKL